MLGTFEKLDVSYMNCKCKMCVHDWRNDCIEGYCNCCELEDGFSLVVKAEFDSR
jgi:hypothetical protein